MVSAFFFAPCSSRFLVTFSNIAVACGSCPVMSTRIDGRMLVRVIGRLRHRQAQLAAVNVRQIVQRESQTDARLC